MGAISALIVGPCVAAPLAGALVYISQTRDVLIGGAALFAMAVGMSIPLLLVGVSAGSLLPRAGAWMESVKKFFGVLMLAMALWLVSPVLPPVVQMLGWTALLLGYGVYLLRSSRHLGGDGARRRVRDPGRDPAGRRGHRRRAIRWRRWPTWAAARRSMASTFTRIKTVAQLDARAGRHAAARP